MNFPNESDARLARERLASGCETMKLLLNGLMDSKGRVAEEVHAIRKLGKSLRGGFSLFRLENSAACEIQAIGRLLASPRDTVSRFSTWNKLAWNDDPPLAAAVAGLLEQLTHSAARRPPPETMAWCMERVDAALMELHALPAENLVGRIAEGLEKIARRTAKRCGKLDHRVAKDFHEARKALKAWLGAIGFLPDGVIHRNPMHDKLAEVLGDENDLATLSAWLDEHGFTAKFAPHLWAAIEKSRLRLQRKASKDAAKLAPAKPG